MEMRKKVNRGYRIFNIVASVIIGLFTLVCLIPFLLLLIGSFTDNTEVLVKGYSFIPEKWSLDAYKYIFA
jgi:putative aldouronate transport system permease protein